MKGNIFENAQQFYKKNPLPQISDKRRKFYTKELLFVIETAPFLTANEKAQMSQLIPIYSTKVIKNVKNSLIQQGLIHLQLNPINKTTIEEWLNSVSEKTT
jgi:hypothetical protein